MSCAGTTSVVVVGDIVTDVVVVHSGPLAAGSDTPARISVGGGGSAANTAAWLAATGVPAMLVGVVGTDDAGTARLRELTDAGVRCMVRRSPERPTGSVVVLVDAAERTMLSDRGANRLLTPADIAGALDRGGHLHLSGYPLLDPATVAAGRYALAAARERGMTTSVDAASAQPLRRIDGAAFLSWVRGIDLLLANTDEARALLDDGDASAQRLAAALTAWAPRVVVKRGGAGSVWADAAGVVAAAAHPAEVVDPTGAGDAFAAGLLGAWLTGATPDEALAAGARLGARAVAVVGGRPPATAPDR